MRKFIYFIALCMVSCSSNGVSVCCNSQNVILGGNESSGKIIASGNLVTKDFDVKAFTAIRSSSSLDVEYIVSSEAEKPHVTVTAPDNIIEYVKIDVGNGGELSPKIDCDKSIVFESEQIADKFKVTITYSGVNSFTTSGAADINIIGALTAEKGLKFSTSGAGDIENTGSITCPVLECLTSGAGEIDLTGLTVGNLTARTSGAGDIELEGTTEHVSLHASGAGDIDAKKLRAATGEAYASGASSIDCNIRNITTSSSSGASSVHNQRR